MANPKPLDAAPKSNRRTPKIAAGDVAPPKASLSSAGVFKLTLPPKTIKTLSNRKAPVRAFMEALGAQMDESRRSGRAGQLLVEIDPRGEPRLVPPKAADSPIPDGELEAALSAARERGRSRAAEILSGGEMLSADAFADLIGVSRVTVNAKRQKHEVLGLDGAKRGFRFPAWQLDADGKPFGVMPLLFDRLGASPWRVYRFLVQHHAELDGRTGLDALRNGEASVVVETAESLANGTFG